MRKESQILIIFVFLRPLKQLFSILFFFISTYTFATHIVGGELNYYPLKNSKYRITLKLYIDCYNGQAAAISQDQYANIAVYGKDSNQLLPNLCFAVKRGAPVRVSKTNYNCILLAPNACVDAYYYDTVVTLPYRVDGYILSFQRCCRNVTIINLVDPNGTGENIWTQITDTAQIGSNSSPTFKNLPPNFLCTNAPLVFDHSAYDIEGDSLVYEFFHPYTGGNPADPRPSFSNDEPPPFSKVTFQSGYTYNVAINSNPMASINSKTGVLKITPTYSGQFVVGIVVKEYRNGALIGFTQRDYQFNVQECVFETTSAFVSPDINCDREVFFTNNSNNAKSYLWNYGDTTTLADTSNKASGYYKYPKAGVYNVKLIAKNGNCMDSVLKTITILENITFQLPKDTLLCNVTNKLLFPSKFYFGATYLWSTGSTDSIINTNSSGTFWLKITYGKCIKYDTCLITLDDLKVAIFADSLNCNPESKNLEGKLQIKGPFKSIEWESIPQQLAQDYSDSFAIVNEKGLFKISGQKTNGCPYSDSVVLDGQLKQSIFRFANVFTPNNDGWNDVYPELKPPYNYHLTIFDRWGLKIHETDNIPWNSGKFPNGTYYYFIEADGCGQHIKTHGVVQVIKD